MAKEQLVQADITKLDVDIVVNAANSALSGGGGVDGAIHRAAGPELLAACRTFTACPTGEAVITEAYNLPASWVIHAVGPVWQTGDQGEPDQLANCYRAALSLAREKQATSIAFPAISCGVYRFPHDQAAKIAIDSVRAGVKSWPVPLTVIFCCFDPKVYRAYERAF